MPRPYYIFKSGRLKREENTLVFKTEGEEKVRIPIHDVLELFLFGEVDVNTKLLAFLSKKGILVHIFDWYGHYRGSFFPRKTLLSGELLIRQVEYYLDDEKRLDLATRFVKGGIENMRVVIRELGGDPDLLPLPGDVQSIPDLMSFEARVRQAYYSLLDDFLPEDFQIGTRTRRPPRNEANALLSFMNGLLYAEIVHQLYKTHLDQRISYLHAPSSRRYSLSLDVAEVFKPPIAERLFLRLIRKKEIRKDDFKEEVKGILLTREGMRKAARAFEERLNRTFYHRRLKRKISMRTLIRMELYKLEKHFLNIQPYEPYKLQW